MSLVLICLKLNLSHIREVISPNRFHDGQIDEQSKEHFFAFAVGFHDQGSTLRFNIPRFRVDGNEIFLSGMTTSSVKCHTRQVRDNRTGPCR